MIAPGGSMAHIGGNKYYQNGHDQMKHYDIDVNIYENRSMSLVNTNMQDAVSVYELYILNVNL